MARNNNYRKSGGGLNWTAIIVSIICAVMVAAVIVVGVGSDWFKISNPSKWFGRGESAVTPNTPDDDNNNVVADGKKDGMMITTQSTDTVKLTARAVSNPDKLPSTDNKYYLTATVMPADAHNKELVWTSTDTQGKYIRISVSEDAHKAEVTCLKDFGEPIVITAQSKEYPEVKATCECNYLQRYNVTMDMPKIGLGDISCTISENSSAYTVATEIEMDEPILYINQLFFDYIINQVDDDNRAYADHRSSTGTYNAEAHTINFSNSLRSFFYIDTGDGFDGNGDDEEALYQKLYKAFRDSVSTYSGEQAVVHLTYKVYYGNNLFETKTLKKAYNFDYESVKVALGDVGLSDSDILM